MKFEDNRLKVPGKHKSLKLKREDNIPHYYFLSKEGRLFDIWDKNTMDMTEEELKIFCKSIHLDCQLVTYSDAYRLEKKFDRELRRQLKKENKESQLEVHKRRNRNNWADGISYRSGYYAVVPYSCFNHSKDGLPYIAHPEF